MSEPYYATSRDAEQAFYAAFQKADLAEMMQVWADDDSIVCIHPMGPRLDGRAVDQRALAPKLLAQLASGEHQEERHHQVGSHHDSEEPGEGHRRLAPLTDQAQHEEQAQAKARH